MRVRTFVALPLLIAAASTGTSLGCAVDATEALGTSSEKVAPQGAAPAVVPSPTKAQIKQALLTFMATKTSQGQMGMLGQQLVGGEGTARQLADGGMVWHDAIAVEMLADY